MTEEWELFREYMADPAARAAFVELKAERAADGSARRYQHVLAAVGGRPWAISEPMLMVILDVLTFRAYGGRFTAEELEARLEGRRRSPSRLAPAGVARIPVSGVIVPKAGGMNEMSGGTSVQSIRQALHEALATPEVAGILLDFDSPGGMVDGIPELAADIRSARERVPVVALADTEALSAGYWLASQADAIVAAPSARVGSIGVVSAHEDRSAQQEQKGVRTTLLTAGAHKADGNPFEPLSGAARERMQALVDEYYGMFVRDVAEGRKVAPETVRGGFGEGSVLSASEALRLGMVDAVGGLPEAVGLVASMAESRLAPAAEAAEQAPTAEQWDAWADLNLRGIPQASEEAVVQAWEDDVEAVDIAAAVDESDWDGNRAMGMCSSAADYRSICAGERSVGQPDERQHWALPHHYLGRGPNANGVRNALARLPQTQGLTNRGAAQAHLRAHMSSISPGATAPSELDDLAAELEMLRLS